jgi:exosortase
MIFFPVVAVLATCWHSFVTLHRQWTNWADTTQAHGYLIVALCLWLLWRIRNISADTAALSWWRPWPLALAMIFWLFAVTAGIQVVELLLVPMILWCAIGAGFGWRAARRAVFPAAYFFFATPVWVSFNGLFQWSSVYAVRAILRAAGIPAYFEENRIQIPEGTFEIAGGCSGLHFVVVAAAIASLLGELRRDGLIGRIKLLLLAVALAMLANWARIVVIVEAGHLTNMQHYLVARSHYGFGWFVFALCMALFFWLESRMQSSKSPTSSSADTSLTPSNSPRRWGEVSLGVVPVLALFALWHALAARPVASKLAVPDPPGGWSMRNDLTRTWKPRLVGVDDAQQILYGRADGTVVEAFFGLYRYQGQDKEFSAYENDLYPGADLLDQDALVIAGTPFVLRRFRRNSGDEALVAASYRVGSKAFSQPIKAQLWYGVAAMLRLRAPPSQVVLLQTTCLPDCASARNVLREWREGS